jgi:hypothetical protein
MPLCQFRDVVAGVGIVEPVVLAQIGAPDNPRVNPPPACLEVLFGDNGARRGML